MPYDRVNLLGDGPPDPEPASGGALGLIAHGLFDACLPNQCEFGEIWVHELAGSPGTNGSDVFAWYGSAGQPGIDGYWQALNAGQRAPYQAEYNSIVGAWNDLVTRESAGAFFLNPLLPKCCTAQDIGIQARNLIQQIAAATGVSGPVNFASPTHSPVDTLADGTDKALRALGDTLASLLGVAKWVGYAAVLGVVFFAGYEGYQVIKESRK